MALISRLQRKLEDMGLVPKIIAQLPMISTICVIISLIWLAVLPIEGQFRHTYISENALMPSQAYSYFRKTEWNILRGYRSQIEDFGNLNNDQRNEQMAEWLQEFGTKTSIYRDEKGYGDSLHGLLHAQRGDGTEAILLAVPWFNSEGELNVGGAALGISLCRFFSRWPIWSKNIIVVFSENPDAALRAWVQAYHTSLDLTGGSIEAAIVVDYPGTNDYFDYVEVNYEGLNGELPNLDLVNIAVSIAEHEGVKVTLHGMLPKSIDDESYWSRLKVLIRGIYRTAFAGLGPLHGNEAFGGWRIQALTLKAHGSEEGKSDITTFGRIPEAMFRSINNLLEKFHQSYFFYMMVAPRYFVSISSYLPATVVLSVGFALASLNSLLNNQYNALSFFSQYNLIALSFWLMSILISFVFAQLFLLIPSTALLIVLMITVASFPVASGRLWTIAEPLSHRLQAYAFFYMSLVITSLMMVDFTLALVIGILAFPMTIVGIQRLTFKKYALLIISNPFVSLFFLVPRPRLLQNLISAWQDLGCWIWPVLFLGWLPSWILVSLSVHSSSINNNFDPAQMEKKQQ